jgi:hypothetical protein
MRPFPFRIICTFCMLLLFCVSSSLHANGDVAYWNGVTVTLHAFLSKPSQGNATVFCAELQQWLPHLGKEPTNYDRFWEDAGRQFSFLNAELEKGNKAAFMVALCMLNNGLDIHDQPQLRIAMANVAIKHPVPFMRAVLANSVPDEDLEWILTTTATDPCGDDETDCTLLQQRKTALASCIHGRYSAFAKKCVSMIDSAIADGCSGEKKNEAF